MKPTLIAYLLFFYSSAIIARADADSTENIPAKYSFINRVNFYVADKPQKKDVFSRWTILRARIKGMRHRNKLIIIVASSSQEASDKILDYLQERKAMIGDLWFDSHGHYINGFSSFSLGHDQFNYKNINDTAYTKYLSALAPYCDEETKIALGSCYSGATYDKPVWNDNKATRMNGDSLMIGLANILSPATIFGTEGWIMMKPGVFDKHSYALAGYLLGKSCKDEVYRPVWERLGVWHSYSTITQRFETVNTLSLSRFGSINIHKVSYLEKGKAKKRVARNIKKLKPGLIKA